MSQNDKAQMLRLQLIQFCETGRALAGDPVRVNDTERVSGVSSPTENDRVSMADVQYPNVKHDDRYVSLVQQHPLTQVCQLFIHRRGGLDGTWNDSRRAKPVLYLNRESKGVSLFDVIGIQRARKPNLGRFASVEKFVLH
jgi:hypothetical protein